MQVFEIDKELTPVTFTTVLNEREYRFTLRYNTEGDYFTMTVSLDGEVLAVGEKLVYGWPLFGAYADDRFPPPIVPLDRAGIAQEVTWETFGKNVLLYVGEDIG